MDMTHEEYMERIKKTDSAPGPEDVAPVEHITYEDEKAVADDGGNR
jgi:hypothetical protein